MAVFSAICDSLQIGRVERYRLAEDDQPMPYARVLELWQTDGSFRTFFTALLADSALMAYRWETPPISNATKLRPFEFVLLNSPGFVTRESDAETYRDYYSADDTDGGVVSFSNLRGDASLIVPSPRTGNEAYGHLAAFIRRAPQTQVDSLWRIVGQTVASRLGDAPLWLSTAGGGVAWLHVRLDSIPKYYGFDDYRKVKS